MNKMNSKKKVTLPQNQGKVIDEKKTSEEGGEERYKEVKVTTISGPQAEDLISALRTGGGLHYVDISVRGLCILEVYTEDNWFWEPCASTIPFEIASPKPVRPCFRVILVSI